MRPEHQEMLHNVAVGAQQLYRNVLRPAVITGYREVQDATRLIVRWGINNVVRPGVRNADHWSRQPMPQMSRRVFIGTLLAEAAIGWTIEHKWQDFVIGPPISPNQPALPPTPRPESPRVSERRNPFLEPFEDQDANEIAKELGIDAGSFFHIPRELMPKLQAFLQDELLPIYPPAVYQYRKEIYEHSAKSNMPPNVVAMIMSIESAGRANASSPGVGANGLMQVMPMHFNKDGIYDIPTMLDPDKNIEYGIKVYQDFLNYTRNIYPNWERKSAAVFTRALMGYNGGGNAVENEVPTSTVRAAGSPRTPEESAFYGDHMIRLIVTAEVAARLRQKGFSDSQIVAKLSSNEVNARAYVMGQFHKRSIPYPYSLYDDVIKQIAKPDLEEAQGSEVSPEVRAQLKKDYDEYFKNPGTRLPYAASAGLRIWMLLGGRSLVEQETSFNTNPNLWLNINSRKSSQAA